MVKTHEGADTVKRELARANEELSAIQENQKRLGNRLEQEHGARDPERTRSMRRDVDELGKQRFRAEVRVKALEIKMLEVLTADGEAADPELREKTNTLLQQRWEDLRALCENPSRTVWQGGAWVKIPSSSPGPIEDLREHLRSFDVNLPEPKK